MLLNSIELRQLRRQAEEIIKHNGRCPTNTMCLDCLYKYINKTVSNCNPFTVLKAAKTFIEEQKFCEL